MVYPLEWSYNSPVRIRTLIGHSHNPPAIVFSGPSRVMLITERYTPVRLTTGASPSRVPSLYLNKETKFSLLSG